MVDYPGQHSTAASASNSEFAARALLESAEEFIEQQRMTLRAEAVRARAECDRRQQALDRQQNAVSALAQMVVVATHRLQQHHLPLDVAVDVQRVAKALAHIGFSPPCDSATGDAPESFDDL